MDETQIILQCLEAGTPSTRRRRVPKEVVPVNDIGDIGDIGDDPIIRMARKSKKPVKKREIHEWIGKDFLNYLNNVLALYGTQLVAADSRDGDIVNRIHDCFVDKFNGMDNKVLRDYFDWWAGNHAARFQIEGKEIYIQTLSREYYIDAFLEQNCKTVDAEPVAEITNETDAALLYKTGGLPILLKRKGIVVAYCVIGENAGNHIINVLHSFSKDMLISVMEQTLSGAPYLHKDMINFLMIARNSLDYHGITTYNNLNYEDYFTQEVK